MVTVSRTLDVTLSASSGAPTSSSTPQYKAAYDALTAIADFLEGASYSYSSSYVSGTNCSTNTSYVYQVTVNGRSFYFGTNTYISSTNAAQTITDAIRADGVFAYINDASGQECVPLNMFKDTLVMTGGTSVPEVDSLAVGHVQPVTLLVTVSYKYSDGSTAPSTDPYVRILEALGSYKPAGGLQFVVLNTGSLDSVLPKSGKLVVPKRLLPGMAELIDPLFAEALLAAF